MEPPGGSGCFDFDGGGDDMKFRLVQGGQAELCEDGRVGGDVEMGRCAGVVVDV